MRTERELQDMLNLIRSDERLGYDSALVQVNAPLALIQTELEARADVLEWALGHTRATGGGSAGRLES